MEQMGKESLYKLGQSAHDLKYADDVDKDADNLLTMLNRPC